MNQATYSVISVGERGNAGVASVARQFLSKAKGLTPGQVEAVLEGVPTIIQQGVDEDTATNLAESMSDIGLKCHVVKQNTQASFSGAENESLSDPQAAATISSVGLTNAKLSWPVLATNSIRYHCRCHFRKSCKWLYRRSLSSCYLCCLLSRS